MGDGSNDALRGYVKAGMPINAKVGKACPHCGRWNYTSNECRPQLAEYCPGYKDRDGK